MLKGHTKIELTDVNTGAKQVIEEDNMVTNALAKLFGHNYFGSMSSSVLLSYFQPLLHKAIGGIMCFDSAIEENPETIYKPHDANVTAHADETVNASAVTSRGSFNTTESGDVEGGYKWVWDFATSQGNGTIASMSLCHPLMGRSGFNDIGNDSTVYLTRQLYRYTSPIAKATNYKDSMVRFIYNKMFYTHVITTTSDIHIKRYKTMQDSVSLVHNWNTGNYVDELHLNAGSYNFTSGYVSYSQDGQYGYIIHKPTSSSSTINVYIINLADNTVATKTITLPSGITVVNGEGYCTACNGRIYMMTYDTSSKYFIYVYDSDTLTLQAVVPCSSVARLEQFGGYVYWNKNYLVRDWLDTPDVVRSVSSNYDAESNINDDGLAWYSEYDSSSNYITLYQPLTYLVTINNLETPVTKTSSQTMKITYTLTEQES